MMNNKLIIFSLITLIISTFFLSSCGPIYTTRNEYVPPTTPRALTCLNQCEAKINICQNSCDVKKQQCMQQASRTASLTLPTEETAYVNKLERYITEKKYYDLEQQDRRRQLRRLEIDYDLYGKKCNGDKYFCTRQNEIKRELRDLKYASKIDIPRYPIKPTLTSETLRHQASCSADCGCKLRYDSCYTSCGGQIVPHKICTSNCPEKK